jgi:hypothetical protein
MREIAVIKRDLEAANCWVFGDGLHPPSTATVLRAQGDEVLLTDGPFVEGKEVLGGITIIAAPDLDAALGWARRYARAAPGRCSAGAGRRRTPSSSRPRDRA